VQGLAVQLGQQLAGRFQAGDVVRRSRLEVADDQVLPQVIIPGAGRDRK